MILFDSIFNNKKKKEDERLRVERLVALDANIEKTTQIQTSSNEVQKSVMEIAWKNQELNEKLTQLVLDNERTKIILLERENKITTLSDNIEERIKEIRKEEIEIIARKSEVRRSEQLVEDQKLGLERELKRVIEREDVSNKIKEQADEEKEKYQILYDEVEAAKSNIEALEEEAKRKNKEADEKTSMANSIFEKSKIIDEEIKTKEVKFEEYRESIEKSLNEKIKEYDRRLADLDSVKDLVDDAKFDNSEDGHQAKIVVKEAIRQAKKALTDIKTRFDELDENYSSGTFKGFSTPLTAIDKEFSDLKAHYIQIKDHIATNESLPDSVSKWLNVIENCITNADRSIKSWEFSEAYRNIVYGISACQNYELLLAILMDWANTSPNEEEVSETDDFTDWYVILEVEIEATDDEIKKQYKILIKKYHPDRAPEGKHDEYHKKSTELNQAYEILGDAEKRNAFNEKRSKRKNSK